MKATITSLIDSLATKTSFVVDKVNTVTGIGAFLTLVSDAAGASGKSVAYFFYGIPASNSFSWVDLNDLPSDMTVIIQFWRDGKAPNISQFRGKAGRVIRTSGVQSIPAAAPEALLVPDTALSEKDVLAIINAVAGPTTQTKNNTVVVESCPSAVYTALEALVAKKYIAGIQVGRKT